MSTLEARIQHPNKTAATWASENPTLLDGELAFESDTRKMKIGPGAYNSLGYISLPPVVWRGNWATSTVYALNDVVSQSGNSYIAITAHTSGTFATDLAASKWQLLASKGDSGSGGNYETSSNLVTSAAIATHFATSDLPVFMDTNVTVSANPQTFPSNARFVQGGGKFVKSGSGKIAFAGPAFADPTSMSPMLSGFAAGDITFTGTAPAVLGTNLWDDADWGNSLTKAMASVVGKDTTIAVYPKGTPTAQIIWKSGHRYDLSIGTFNSAITDASQICHKVESNVTIAGCGQGITILKESGVALMQRQFYGSNAALYPFDGHNEEIYFRDFTILGDSSQTVDSAASTIEFGNCVGFGAERITFKDTHGFACYAGLFGTQGYFAENGYINDCVCDGLQTQQIGVLSARNVEITHNKFINIGTPTSPSQAVIDIEPNTSYDCIDGIKINYNFIDARNGQSTINGISLNTSSAAIFRNVQVIGNTIRGADDYPTVGLTATNFIDVGDKIKVPGHGLLRSTVVVLTTSGTIPGGLSTAATYYVIPLDTEYIQLASSYANSLTGTAVAISSAAGSGTHNIVPIRKLTIGIAISGGDGVQLYDNIITGCGQNGLSVNNTFNARIVNNTLRCVGGGGNPAIYINSCVNSTYFNNDVTSNSLPISQSTDVTEVELTLTVNTTAGSPDVAITSGGTVALYHWIGRTVTINAVDYVIKSVGLPDSAILTLTTNAASNLTGTTLTAKAFNSNRYVFNNWGTLTKSSGSTSVETAVGGVGGTVGVTDNVVPRANGTGGSTLQGSAVSIDDNGTINLPSEQALNIAASKVIGHNNSSGFVSLNEGGLGFQTRIYGGVVFLGSGLVTYVNSNGQLVLANIAAPSSASATGTQGEIRWDSGFIYVCTATNTWKRVAIATW
jgi:hypothetical protein